MNFEYNSMSINIAQSPTEKAVTLKQSQMAKTDGVELQATLEANNFHQCLSEFCWGGRSATCGDQVRTWLWGWDLVKPWIKITQHWASRLGMGQGFSLAISNLWKGPISPIALEEG